MKKPGWNSNSLFVTGTDTGVGKTVLSLLLMRLLFEKGENPFYIKLIQTGCANPHAPDSDAGFIYEHVPALKGKDPGESVPYCFQNPKAPWFAARDEGKKIDLKVFCDFVERKKKSNSPLILEGAGGLFVPVTENTLMIDLIALLGARPILAARAGLGTINHTILSIEALRVRGIEAAGVVFLDAGETETPEEMIKENAEAIEKFSGIKVAATIGRIAGFSNPPKECYQALSTLFS